MNVIPVMSTNYTTQKVQKNNIRTAFSGRFMHPEDLTSMIHKMSPTRDAKVDILRWLEARTNDILRIGRDILEAEKKEVVFQIKPVEKRNFRFEAYRGNFEDKTIDETVPPGTSKFEFPIFVSPREIVDVIIRKLAEAANNIGIGKVNQQISSTIALAA